MASSSRVRCAAGESCVFENKTEGDGDGDGDFRSRSAVRSVTVSTMVVVSAGDVVGSEIGSMDRAGRRRLNECSATCVCYAHYQCLHHMQLMPYDEESYNDDEAQQREIHYERRSPE